MEKFDFPIYYCKHDGVFLLAFGINENEPNAQCNHFSDLDAFLALHSGKYIFGHLSYDLKNEIERLTSSHQDDIAFQDLHFFRPQYVVSLKEEQPQYLEGNPTSESDEFIRQFLNPASGEATSDSISLEPRISKHDYQDRIAQIKRHLQQGDCYEITFCQEYFAKGVSVNPIRLFRELDAKTNAPFGCFVHLNGKFLMSGSPERFLQKEGNILRSQPIKGTAKRGKNLQEDQQIQHALEASEKERSENIMIVDLVRNDLSRIAKDDTVKVTELCKLHSFNTVHQLISTIEAELESDHPMSFTAIIKAMFPMGSMTGAPKIKAMELIEAYEQFKRGLFSGSVGYINPNNDFDFNVVIRSILYNEDKKTISCPVGGAITIRSTWEQEYEECLLKVNAMQTLLAGN